MKIFTSKNSTSIFMHKMLCILIAWTFIFNEALWAFDSCLRPRSSNESQSKTIALNTSLPFGSQSGGNPAAKSSAGPGSAIEPITLVPSGKERINLETNQIFINPDALSQKTRQLLVEYPHDHSLAISLGCDDPYIAKVISWFLVEKYALEHGLRIDDNVRQNLLNIFERNTWALTRGKITPEFMVRAYLDGQHGAMRLLREKVKEGINSWSELLVILEMYPTSFERIYVDLDDTIFTTKGYVGSEAWFRHEMRSYGKGAVKMRSQKLQEEERLVKTAFFRTTEPDLAERLNKLRARHPHIEIIGLTARDKLAQPVTGKILSFIGLNIPVIYAGSSGRKKPILLNAINERDGQIGAENQKRREEARQLLVDELKRQPTEDEITEFADLTERKAWVFIDDRMDHIIRERQAESYADLQHKVFALHYKYQDTYDWQAALSEFFKALRRQDNELAVAHGVDALTLMREEASPNKRIQAYFDVREAVQRLKDDRLTMAYIESMSDFLSGGMDEALPQERRGAMLDIYFGFAAPYSKQEFIRAYKDKKISVRKMNESSPGKHAETNYEIVIGKENIYLFLEPLLRHIREAHPDVLVLPDTGARPFLELMTYVIQKEGLHTKLVLFPISRNTASDTSYELKRWMGLVKGDIIPRCPEDREIIKALQPLSESLKGSSSVALLDDNITSGDTAIIIEKTLRSQWNIKSFTALTPFAYKSPESYAFPAAATFRIYGNYSWVSRTRNIAPPLICRTDWEYDNGRLRGARSRARFEYPPAQEVQHDAGMEYRRDLLEQFKADYEDDRAASCKRAPPAFSWEIKPSAPSSVCAELNQSK
ncbi:MAG: DUF2608 domain-containing protein, partial [Candidatus Omnitrophota bacterium]